MGKREEIIDAAATLVHVKGFNNTSIDDILTGSKTGKGQFYHYFDSKEELGFAVIDRQFEAWRDRVFEPIFSEHPGLEAIDVFFTETAAHIRQKNGAGGCPFGNLAQEMSDIHEGFRTKLKGIFETMIGRFAGAFEEAREMGTIRKNVDCRRAGEFTFSTLQGSLLLTKAYRDEKIFQNAHESLKGYMRSLAP